MTDPILPDPDSGSSQPKRQVVNVSGPIGGGGVPVPEVRKHRSQCPICGGKMEAFVKGDEASMCTSCGWEEKLFRGDDSVVE